jgi:uncharacterized protein (TIGR02284 family)
MTMTDPAHKTIKLLNELIELDFDAIDAYQATVARLESPALKETMERFRDDHQRHTQNLGELVVGLGGTPSQGPDMKRFLTKGKVVIADLVGGDHAILTAMDLNEEVTNKAYEAASHVDVPPHVRAVLDRNLADERRHRAWIEAELKSDKKAAAPA